MSLWLNIHHIRFAVMDVNKFVKQLKTQMQFNCFATRRHSKTEENQIEDSVVLRHQDVMFIVDKRDENSDSVKENAFCWGNNSYPVDTACDVCLECSNIEETVERALDYDKNCVVGKVSSFQDEFGTVKYAVLKPPIGNIQHTLVDLSQYNGSFLPGFQFFTNKDITIVSSTAKPDLIQTIDHVAFALNQGQTDVVVQWYNSCLEFSRLIINETEDEKEGFVVQQGVLGLRLKAMFKLNQPMCNETLSKHQNKVPKLVFAEGMSDNFKNDQVTHFLHKHFGPGLQHIAFSTKDIVETVSSFKEKGLGCILAPNAYYDQMSKGEEIKKLKYKIEALRTNNILVESHLCLRDNVEHASNSPLNISTNLKDQILQISNSQWFIMQVFTKPVFEENTLFFEIIQRFQTLSGFGAGNISALWKAIQSELFER